MAEPEESLVVRFRKITFDRAWRLYGGGQGQVGVWYKLRDPDIAGRVHVLSLDGEVFEREYVDRSVLVVADVVHLPSTEDDLTE